jgi:hypothetical protein
MHEACCNFAGLYKPVTKNCSIQGTGANALLRKLHTTYEYLHGVHALRASQFVTMLWNLRRLRVSASTGNGRAQRNGMMLLCTKNGKRRAAGDHHVLNKRRGSKYFLECPVV